ncbi:hypothetical protein [Bacillus atrophaeus]|uniref:hypothetical protein n=1 Tax=Bacillus atrophaeus TaxID=1452 RepID=UPI00228153C3|nr:hypothetical protein [Bacillus atrophaeus]MCY9204371.1 hypothetical protein [Bacillus atrophaeus]MEC0885313.1 hypothetical protein [Bacillus atrophaeus]
MPKDQLIDGSKYFTLGLPQRCAELPTGVISLGYCTITKRVRGYINERDGHAV